MTPPLPRSPSPYRIYAGQKIRITAQSSLGSVIRIRGTIEFDDGSKSQIFTEFTPTSDRLVTTGDATGLLLQNGTVTQLHLAGSGKRGQTFVAAAAGDQAGALWNVFASGYVGDNGLEVALGDFVKSGPGDGEGFLSWVSLAADIAPVDVTRILAATNALRKIHGFVLYYNRAAGAGDVTVNASLRRPGLAVPTGFTGVGNIWLHPGALTLSASEEGMLYADEKLIIGNDAGVIAIASTATQPGPFPYWATEDDLAELFFDVAGVIAGDVWSVYLKQEEWLVI